jgi:hypothetical protein
VLSSDSFIDQFRCNQLLSHLWCPSIMISSITDTDTLGTLEDKCTRILRGCFWSEHGSQHYAIFTWLFRLLGFTFCERGPDNWCVRLALSVHFVHCYQRVTPPSTVISSFTTNHTFFSFLFVIKNIVDIRRPGGPRGAHPCRVRRGQTGYLPPPPLDPA